MNISVFGLGYVGTVSAACFAELGHPVVGVDVDAFKVDAINRGESPIVEELIGELVDEMVRKGRLRATTSSAEAVAGTDLSLVCVGTPSLPDGGLETAYIKRVADEIGDAIKLKDAYHVVVMRSTMLPGTVEDLVIPALAARSGKTAGEDFGVCFHPEFLREGSSVRDFRDPPKIVIGAIDNRAEDALASLYKGFDAPMFRTSIRAAETVKYADNAFHALKVVFGNELGDLCKTLGIDSHEVMRIFVQDTKLNIAPTYLMPGFAYGGSCLPKDLRALLHLARSRHLELPMLASLPVSNDLHLGRALQTILDLDQRRIGMVGLSFKRGTDDLRESPLVELAERLLGKGRQLCIYDENVSLARLRGGNKAFIERRLPHLSELLVDTIDSLIERSDVLVIGSADMGGNGRMDGKVNDKVLVDLVRLNPPPRSAAYYGLCW